LQAAMRKILSLKDDCNEQEITKLKKAIGLGRGATAGARIGSNEENQKAIGPTKSKCAKDDCEKGEPQSKVKGVEGEFLKKFFTIF